MKICVRWWTLSTLLGFSLISGATFASGTPAAPATPAGAQIDVNTATEAQLRTLPSIGQAEARRIVAGRPYKSLDDFFARAGLPANSRPLLRPRLRLGGEASGAAPAPGEGGVPDPNLIKEPPRGIAWPVSKKLDINSASREELATVPGMTTPLAFRLIHGRPYKSLAELSRAGLSRKRILDLAAYLRVGKPAK